MSYCTGTAAGAAKKVVCPQNDAFCITFVEGKGRMSWLIIFAFGCQASFRSSASLHEEKFFSYSTSVWPHFFDSIHSSSINVSWWKHFQGENEVLDDHLMHMTFFDIFSPMLTLLNIRVSKSEINYNFDLKKWTKSGPNIDLK